MTITQKTIPLTNYQVGRNGKTIDKIVIHWIVGDLPAADAVFQTQGKQVSAHYGVGEGKIHQYVKEENTAYHAGNWDANLTSIGIEHRGGPNLPVTDAVYATSSELLADISKRRSIPLDTDHIKPHKAFKATACPGTVDIERLIREATAKLNPAPDLQVQLDKMREERDRNWNLFQSVNAQLVEANKQLTGANQKVAKYEKAIQDIDDYIDRLKAA